jgi:uncharacterized protein (DUF58 family)
MFRIPLKDVQLEPATIAADGRMLPSRELTDNHTILNRLGRLMLGLMLGLSFLINNPLLLLLDVLVLVLLGASWLWGRYCLAGVTYARHFATNRLFFNEETDLWVEVINAKPLPLTWLRAEDSFPTELKVQNVEMSYIGHERKQSLINLYSLRWYERVRRRYRVLGKQRGLFQVGPVSILASDLFGFRLRRSELDYQHTVVVYPKIVPVKNLDVFAARPVGDFKTDRRITEDALRLAGVRDYRVGDTPRHIHWKATARRSALQTKTFDPSASQHILILLNCQTLEHYYEGHVSDFLETAIVVAASVANEALEDRRAIGLASNAALRGSEQWIHIPASRHAAQPVQLLEALAQIDVPPLIPFEDLIRLETSRLPYGTTIIAISSIATEPILAALLDLRSAGHPVGLISIGRAPTRSIPVQIPYSVVTENWTEMQSIDLASG